MTSANVGKNEKKEVFYITCLHLYAVQMKHELFVHREIKASKTSYIWTGIRA